MKTLVEKETNVSVHLFNEDTLVNINEAGFQVDGQDLDTEYNTNNAEIISSESVPDDWYGKKYKYVNGEWVLNPNDPILT